MDMKIWLGNGFREVEKGYRWHFLAKQDATEPTVATRAPGQAPRGPLWPRIFFKTLIIGESSVVISQSLEMRPIFRQRAEISLFQMCTVGSGSTEHSNLNFFAQILL